jgi:hypothetical protein
MLPTGEDVWALPPTSLIASDAKFDPAPPVAWLNRSADESRYGVTGGGSLKRGALSSNDALMAMAICVSSSSWIWACLSASLGSPGAVLNTRDTLSTFGSTLLNGRRERVLGVALEGVVLAVGVALNARGDASVAKSPPKPETEANLSPRGAEPSPSVVASLSEASGASWSSS